MECVSGMKDNLVILLLVLIFAIDILVVVRIIAMYR